MTQTSPNLTEAFWAYERALSANDLATARRFLALGPGTLHGDAEGLAVGHSHVVAAMAAMASMPAPAATAPRRIVQTHLQAIDADHALIVAVTEYASGGRGQQTQLWARVGEAGESGWKLTANHVSTPAPALDTRIWRVVGDPLLPGRPQAALSGHSVAVKDLYAVAGHLVGAGNPNWLAHASPEPDHAWAVRRLLEAGADVRGISRTDEFGYSLAGTNAHYGTPPNPSAPGRISGGSSSGSASAVSLGHATIGLGTDTGGSIRVPAAYQGLFGIRTTHGALPLDGVLPLAPTFDTVGWMTREADLLAAVGEALLPPTPSHRAPTDPHRSRLVVPSDLLRQSEPDVVAAIEAWVAGLTGLETAPRSESWDADLEAWRQTAATLTAHQAWRSRGGWLAPRLGALGDDVRARYQAAREVGEEQGERAAREADQARDVIDTFVADRIVVLPAASSVAPPLGAENPATREATMRLTSIAGLGGLPAVTIPLKTAAGLPCGVCLIAAAGRDKDLLALAAHLTRT